MKIFISGSLKSIKAIAPAKSLSTNNIYIYAQKSFEKCGAIIKEVTTIIPRILDTQYIYTIHIDKNRVKVSLYSAF